MTNNQGLHLEKKTNSKGSTKKGSVLSSSSISTLKKFGDKEKEFFYLELYSMLEAGLDLKKALDIFLKQQKKSKEIEFFETFNMRLVNGSSLYECMKLSHAFTPYEYYCVQIGEESGQILKVLKELAMYFTNKVKIRKQLIKSLSYPIVIFISSVGAISFMLAVIVPMFSDIFKRFNGDLPMMTKVFISLSQFLSENFVLLLIMLATLIIGGRILLKNQLVKQRIQSAYYKIPYVGSLVTGIYNARFCSSMSLLIAARVPLINAINLVSKMVDFYPLQKALANVELDILKGESFNETLAKQKIFDEKTLSLIKIGEEVNRLDDFFEKLHQRYLDEVDIKSNALNTFLEPLIIIFLGMVVGLILIAMYLPMFKLSTSMGI